MLFLGQKYYYPIDIKRFVKILFRILIIFLIISLLLGLLLAVPAVQTAVANYFTKRINAQTGVHLEVDKLQITLNGNIILKDFIAYDTHNDTIFYGKRLQTRIRNPLSIDKDNALKFSQTYIESLKGKIIYYKGTKESNLDAFIRKIDNSSSPSTDKEPFSILIRKIYLTNSSFQYLDYNDNNPVILDLKHIQTDIRDFKQKGDLIAFKSKNIQLIGFNGLIINRLQTDFHYDSKTIQLKKLHLKTPGSQVYADLQFVSPGKGYANFNDKVKVLGVIRPSVIATDDINKFSPVFASGKKINIETQLNGVLNDINFNDFNLAIGNPIRVKGNLRLKNAFSHSNFWIRGNYKNLQFTIPAIQNILPDILTPDVSKTLNKFGRIQITGDVIYGTQKLKTDAIAKTALGNLSIKLNISNLDKSSKADYTGYIQTNDFKLQELLEIPINNITSDFSIKGKGLTLNSLNANINGNLKSLLYQDYQYQNIHINGDFQKKLFQGQFEVADPNLEMDFNGLIDFSQKKRKLDFYAEICKANLYQLNFTTDEYSRLSGEINMQAQGTGLDDVVGKIVINGLSVANQFGTYNYDTFTIQSDFNEKQERNLHFKSTDILNGYIKGKFKFESIPLIIQNSLGSIFANYEVKPLNSTQYLTYNLQIHNKIFRILSPDVEVASHTQLKGKINSKDNSLKLKLISTKINYGKTNFVNVNLRIDNKNPLYNTFLKVDTIKTAFYTFKNLRLLNTTIRDTLYLKTKFEGGRLFKDKYDIAFFYTMDEWQNFIFGLQKSHLQFKNIPWLIDPLRNKNRIVYNDQRDSLRVDDVGVFYQNEKLNFEGLKNKDSLNFLMRLDSINLVHITPNLKDFAFEGMVNGKIQLSRYKKNVLPSTVLNIKNFKLNGELLGDVNLKINVLPKDNIFIDLAIVNKDRQVLKLLGYLDIKNGKPVLNATLLLNKFPVKTLQELFKDSFGNIRGKISGKVEISGPLDNLSFDGKLHLYAFGLRILALNVDYQFKDKTIVYLHGQSFELKDAEFYDTKYNSKGKISGEIKHHNFNNWYLDLNIQTPNLLVLDTPPDPLEMFYGKVFAGGKARIHGYVDRLKIDAEMTTKPQTDFVITLNDVDTTGGDDFVRIISKQDYQKEKKNKKKRRKIYEGIEMNFDLNITPDAQVKIILDPEFGSTLVAKGEGLVLMQINTNGQFNIFGDFAVKEGIYNFKSYGVIDKKFKVEPGSYISWEGDPYNATLDIKATYETFADPTVLLADQGLAAKNMPVETIIYLKNRLMKPDISFDLELPKANAILKSQIDYILSDPDKKNLQVLSLLSFGNFINENDYNLSREAGRTAVKTISETGLNILNSIMAQDDKFQVNLNYTRGDENIERNIVTDPQVGLSLVTKINKMVYINGKVAIPVGRYTKSSIVGDVELEIYLDKKGHLVFRVFNKQTELEYLGQQEGYTQGMGISYQVDFDTFSEILRKLGISVKTD